MYCYLHFKTAFLLFSNKYETCSSGICSGDFGEDTIELHLSHKLPKLRHRWSLQKEQRAGRRQVTGVQTVISDYGIF